jgi:hypothetical protein
MCAHCGCCLCLNRRVVTSGCLSWRFALAGECCLRLSLTYEKLYIPLALSNPSHIIEKAGPPHALLPRKGGEHAAALRRQHMTMQGMGSCWLTLAAATRWWVHPTHPPGHARFSFADVVVFFYLGLSVGNIDVDVVCFRTSGVLYLPNYCVFASHLCLWFLLMMKNLLDVWYRIHETMG